MCHEGSITSPLDRSLLEISSANDDLVPVENANKGRDEKRDGLKIDAGAGIGIEADACHLHDREEGQSPGMRRCKCRRPSHTICEVAYLAQDNCRAPGERPTSEAIETRARQYIEQL